MVEDSFKVVEVFKCVLKSICLIKLFKKNLLEGMMHI